MHSSSIRPPTREHERTRPFASSMNMPRSSARHHARFPALASCGARKASPTVSISNTNVSRVNTTCLLPSPTGLSDVPAHSFIPFPSSPIPCPTVRDDCHDLELPNADGEIVPDDLETSKEQAGPNLADWSNICRRRAKSCLASSYFHHDSGKGTLQAHATSRRPPKDTENRPIHSPTPLRAAKLDSNAQRTLPLARRPSMSSGSPSPKRPRKGKKATPDVQFLAVVHRSIAQQARALEQEAQDDYVAQDVDLAKRLWKNLIQQGFKPVMFDDTPPTSGRADISLSIARDRAPCATSPTAPTRDSTPPTTAPINVSGSPTPVITTPLCTPPVLSMPQLVASLTLRFRERCSSRPRSSTSGGTKDERNPDVPRVVAVQRPSSSLAQVVITNFEPHSSIPQEDSETPWG